MRTLNKLVIPLLAATLVVIPPSATGDPVASIDAQALDVNRSYEHVGPASEAAEIHARRLAAGPKGDELAKLAEDRKYVVDTPADIVDLTSAATEADIIDAVSFDECNERHLAMDPPWWFKNKYNICSAIDREVKYFEMVDGRLTHVGSTFFHQVLIGTGQEADNTVRFGVRLVHSHDTGTTHKDEARLALKIGCRNADPTRQSACTTSPAEAEKTVRQWELDGTAGAAWFITTFSTTDVPADMYAAEKRGYFSFDLHGTIRYPSSGAVHTHMSATESIRCDEATYVRGSKCVFSHVASSLSFDAGSPTYGESARFIRDAQTNITSTKPGPNGKKVLGRFGQDPSEPLHRLYKAYDAENDIDGSRRKVRRTCQRFFGVGYTINAAGEVRQCDEYPFATTYENAARVDESAPFTFAVRPINALHNETAGRIYGQWLGEDHILDRDPFYIIIR